MHVSIYFFINFGKPGSSNFVNYSHPEYSCLKDDCTFLLDTDPQLGSIVPNVTSIIGA